MTSSLTRCGALLAFSLLGMFEAQARLGETFDQCVNRFGTPTSSKDMADPGGVGESAATFLKNGYLITVAFLHGVAQAETYHKVTGDDLSVFEMGSLLDSESAGQTWARGQNASATREMWFRPDGAGALHDMDDHYLAFYSNDYINAKAAQTQAADQNRVKDF